jgi:hypothetical protein
MRRDTELCGASFFESGQVDSWIDFSSHELELPATMWYYPIIGYMPHNAAAVAKAKTDLINALNVLEKHLADKVRGRGGGKTKILQPHCGHYTESELPSLLAPRRRLTSLVTASPWLI